MEALMYMPASKKQNNRQKHFCTRYCKKKEKKARSINTGGGKKRILRNFDDQKHVCNDDNACLTADMISRHIFDRGGRSTIRNYHQSELDLGIKTAAGHTANHFC